LIIVASERNAVFKGCIFQKLPECQRLQVTCSVIYEKRDKIMSKEKIIRDIILALVFIFYLIYTIPYFLAFKKNPTIFAGKIKVFHLVMMWLIPFFWILILKSLTKSTPGSYEMEYKENPHPFSDNNDDAARASTFGY
jgi:hypothetical protein